MTYVISYTLHGRYTERTGSRAQVQALADYLSKTYRIQAEISQIGGSK